MTWLFLEPVARKLAKNARYVKALRAVHAHAPSQRIADALKKVGVKVEAAPSALAKSHHRRAGPPAMNPAAI